MTGLLLDDSPKTYYLKLPYRLLAIAIVAFGLMVGWLLLTAFSSGDFSADQTGTYIFALIAVIAMFDLFLWIGYRLFRIRLVVSPRGITFYAIGYAIRSTWDNVASLETVSTQSGSVQGLVLNEPGLNINGVLGALLAVLPLMRVIGAVRGRYLPDGSIDASFIPIEPFESDQLLAALQRYAPQISDSPTAAVQPIEKSAEPLPPAQPSWPRRAALVIGVLAIEAVFVVSSVQAWQGGVASFQTLQTNASPVGLTFTGDSQQLLVANSIGELQTWRVSDGTLQHTLPLTRSQWSFAVSADGQMLATGLDDGTVRVWHADGQAWYNLGKVEKTPCPPCASHPPVAFSPDGQSLAAGSYDGTVHVWSMRDGAERLTLKAASDTTADTITSVAFSADGQWLVAGAQSLQNSVQFWRLDTGKLAAAYPGQYVPGDSSFANSLDFSADGQQLAVATLNKGVWLINAANHSLNGTLATSGSEKTDVAVAAFSLDNQYVVAATTSGALQVWRLSDKKLLRTLREHSQGIQQVAFSPDGQYLATGSYDGAVRLWRMADIIK